MSDYHPQDLIRFKIWKAALLTLYTSFSIEVFRVLYSSAGYRRSSLLPWTFEWVWELGVFVLSFFILRRLSANYGAAVVFFFAAFIISSFVWNFYPDSYKVIRPNYYGVEGQLNSETHREGRFDEQEVSNHPLTAGFIYEANDPALSRELSETASDNEYAGTRGFMFWQTGIAYGFYPGGIKGYNGGDTFFDHLELYITVGPLVLLECLITGIYTNFITLIILQGVWFLLKREYLWWHKNNN